MCTREKPPLVSRPVAEQDALPGGETGTVPTPHKLLSVSPAAPKCCSTLTITRGLSILINIHKQLLDQPSSHISKTLAKMATVCVSPSSFQHRAGQGSQDHWEAGAGAGGPPSD